MTSSGKGISDALRGSVRDWMTDTVIDLLYISNPKTIKDLGKQFLCNCLRNPNMWKRLNRRKSDKVGIWLRTYYCSALGKEDVTLTILTNKETPKAKEDSFIESVTIVSKGKPIGGGRVKVPSMLISQKGKQSKFEEFRTDTLFTEFTSKELAELTSKLQFGEEAMFLSIFDERD